MSLKRVDPQDVCDLCCDAPTVDVNNQLIGKVFQWLIDNDYEICKKIPMKKHNLDKRLNNPCDITKRNIQELNHEVKSS